MHPHPDDIFCSAISTSPALINSPSCDSHCRHFNVFLSQTFPEIISSLFIFFRINQLLNFALFIRRFIPKQEFLLRLSLFPLLPASRVFSPPSSLFGRWFHGGSCNLCDLIFPGLWSGQTLALSNPMLTEKS